MANVYSAFSWATRSVSLVALTLIAIVVLGQGISNSVAAEQHSNEDLESVVYYATGDASSSESHNAGVDDISIQFLTAEAQSSNDDFQLSDAAFALNSNEGNSSASFDYIEKNNSIGDLSGALLQSICPGDIEVEAITLPSTVCDDSPNPSDCECQGYIYEFEVEYNGASGILGGAYDYYDNTYLHETLVTGQVYTFNVSNSNHPGEDHEHNDPMMWTYEGGSWIYHGTIDASCPTSIIGTSYGPFTVLGYTDVHGIVCSTATNCNGSADLTVSNGLAPYEYLWSDGSTSGDRDDLCAGEYQVTVTDANGCSTEIDIEITSDTQDVTAVADVTADVICPEFDVCDVLCFESSNGDDDVSAQMSIDILEGPNTITLRTIYAKTFCDNTYGDNAIGWPGNHSFGNLRGSDKLELALYNGNGDLSLQFELDYIDDEGQGPSGYGTGGVSEGDGDMIVGNEAYILDVKTSLSENFNTYGYVLTENSPATDADYTSNPDYPNWIYEVWYEVTIDLDAFGNSGFGYPEITDFHASPSKTGNNSEPVEFSECCGNGGVECTGSIDLTVTEGVAPFTFAWSNGETTEDIYNLCGGSYSVVVTDANGCSAEYTYEVTCNSSCEIECLDDLTLDCESSIDPAYTGYPTLVCNGAGDCDREAGEFDFEFQGWGGATDGWSFGTGWQVGTGCDPACGDIPNVFIDFTNFHTHYNTKLKSPVYDACCTDDVYLSFCLQQDLYGGEDVPGFLAVQYRVNGGGWQTLNTYQNIFGSTVNYDDTYEISGAAGQSFEVRFKAYGEGSNHFTMGGWGIDNVRVYGQSSGCSTPSEVDIDWTYNDSSTGSCPEVITRTFSGEYEGETYACEQTLTIVDEEAPVFTSVPDDAEFSCSETVAASSASAIDNCDDDVTVTQSDEIIGADCNYYIERTFVATDDCGNTATYVQTITIIDDLPTVTATSTDDNCSQNEGTITLSFEDSACRTNIQLSIDGGNSFVNVPDNSGSYTFTGLGEGDYDIVTKWGDGDCITDGDDVHINDNDEIELEIKNLGICIVDLYEWLPDGDQFVEELAPGESIIVTTHLGAMWRIVADNWQPDLFDEQYTVEGCYDQVWNVAPNYCQEDCILEVDITGDTNPCEGEETTLTAEVSNESECVEIINCYTMGNAVSEGNCILTPGTGVIWQRAEGCQGFHTVWAINGELKLTEFANGTATIKGSIVNTENGDIGIVDVTLYDKEDDGNTWNASCYLNGISGPEIYYTSFLGTITVGDEVFTIEEKTSEAHFILADGAGFNPGEYGLGSWTAGTFGGCTEWFASLTPCEIPSQELTYEWSTGDTTQTITVSEDGDYTVIVTDCAGCVATDDVHITFDELPEVTVSSTDVDCIDNNGTITFSFVDNPARTNIEFSIDGGATWPAEYNVLDNSGSFTITGLALGTYDLAVRWGNDECEVDLPDETIEEGCFSIPTVEEGVVDAVTVECDEALPTDEPIFADACDGNLNVEFNETQNDLDCGYELIRTWTATNDCGQAASVSQVITVEDTTDPVLVGVPADQTGLCDDSFAPADVTATDNCDDDVNVSVEETINGAGCNYTITFTYTATDDCGNTSVASYNVIVLDETAPMLEGVPADMTINCDEDPADANVTATDNCDTNVAVMMEQTINDLDCGSEIIRTWTATDDCGNSVSASQTITVVDTEAPVITSQTPDQTIECDQDIPEINVTFVDNCDGDLTVSVDNWINELDCGYEYVKYCSATDDCGNIAEATVTITVLDTTAPEVVSAPIDVTIECDEDEPTDMPVFTDNCDDHLDISAISGIVQLDCGYEIQRSWTATDDCGNSTTVNQVITVVDTTAPMLNGVPANATVECDDIPGPISVTATDNCDDAPVVTVADHINLIDDCSYEIERVWTAVDNCGNENTAIQILTVIDTTAPQVVSTPADVTITCDEALPTEDAEFTDNCDDNLHIDMEDVIVDQDCGYIIERSWVAVDDCDNAVSTTQIITVIDDQAPVITFQTPDQTIECDQDIPEINVTYVDNCDSELTISVNNWINELDCGYEYVKYCSATDDCGNMAEATVIITVLDTTAPEVVSAPADVTIECDEDEPTDMPVFTDNCDDHLDISAISGIVQLDCGYEIQRSWTATDDCGNSTTVNQVITVVDTTAPEFTSTPADYIVNCDNGSSDPEFAGEPTATDNCDDSLVITFEDTVTPDVCPATFERTWTATDNCGNAVSYVQLITINDFVAPTLEVPADVTVECTESTDPSNTGEAMAADDCSVPMVSYEDGPITGDCPYTFERVWTAVDACGNTVSGTQVITIQDSVAPVADGEGFHITISCDEELPEVYMTFTDNCDENIEVTVTTSMEEDGCNVIFYQTCTATDDCGNQTSVVSSITVVDETAPILIGVPADATIDCTDDIPDAIVVAQDNCDDNPVVSLTAETVYHDCGYDIVRTWTAVDACGNTYSESQTLNVFDETAPEIECPADYIVNCDNGSSDPEFAGEPVVTDNCSSFEVTYADGPATDDCPATFERTWTATDVCGNSSSCVQIITINDFTAPMIDCPADVTIECTESTDPMNTGEATATDDCSTPMISYVDGPTTGDCPYTFERTWTATDPCGNSTSCVQVITIEDTVAPVLSGDDEELTLECNVSPTIVPPTATDNCDEDVEVTLSTETIPGDCPQESTDIYTWTAMDECGNTAVRTLTINFVDTTAPVLEGTPENMFVECTEISAAAVVTATDNCDEPAVIYNEDIFVLPCGQLIERTWTATDACGNTTSYTQTIDVVDTVDPMVDFAPQDVTIECDEDEPTDMPMFSDNCDDELEITAISGINNVTDCGYTIERSWTATDDCGNSTSVSQTITVIDTTAPVMEGVPADVTVECSDIPEPAMVTATDNCDDAPVVEMTETITGGCPYNLIRTWTATDACGNQSIMTQTITVIDEEAPVLVGVPADFNGECGDAPSADMVTAIDNCDENVPVIMTEEVIGESCPLTIIRTWTATDNCGNMVSDSQTITINDTTAPEFTSTPADFEVECDMVPGPDNDAIEVADNCDESPVITYDEVIIPGDPVMDGAEPCGYTIERTWTATDLCGNEASFTQIVTVVDTTAPDLVGVPADVTVECTDIPDAPVVTAVDNCYDGEMTVTFDESIVPQTCGYLIVRTWTVEDNCWNYATESQVITVVDTEAPVVLTTPADETIECDEALPTGMPTFEDACDDELSVEMTEMTEDLACGYQLIRTWTATDDCGNAVSTSQSIFVVDTVDPVLAGVPVDMDIECSEIPAAAVVTATDNCDMDVAINFEEVINAGECPYTIVRTWTATDDCGNVVSASQTLTVVDTVAPVLEGVPADATVECDDIPAAPAVTASDNCDDDLMVVFTDEVIANGDCGYMIVRTWTVEDNCGNEASASQTLTVTDTTSPSILTQPASLALECDEEVPFEAPTFEDNCDEDLEVGFNEAIVPGNCANSFTIVRTWVAMDDCGNEVSVVQNIEISDNTAPVLSGVPADADYECTDIPAPAEVTATDNCDMDVTVTYNENFTELDCGFMVTRMWTATDACGNSVTESQTITAIDTTNPVVEFAPADVTIECDEEEPAGMPIFSDNCDDELDITAISGIVQLDCGYLIERSWTATDDCGNSTVVSQTITVVDTTAPVLEGTPTDMTVECDDIPAPAVVTATDNCDETLEVMFSEEVISDGCPYTIERTWTVMDDCGNADSYTQTLSVVDNTDPVLVGVPADETVECDAVPGVPTVSATDNCTDNLMVTFVEVIEDLECGYLIYRTWSTEDECGNNASATQEITVVDTTAPVLVGVPADATAECDDIPEVAVVTATDNCTEDLTVSFIEETIDQECGYLIIRTWSVHDECNNTTSESQVISVVDTTAPVIVSAPEDATVQCDEVPGVGTIEAIDNCDNMLTVDVAEENEDADCGYIITRTYTVTDDCGNTAIHVQVITVTDTEAPVITGVPADLTIECGEDVPAPGDVEVEDNCDPMPVVTSAEVTETLDCGYQIVRTYTATDECGNEATATQTITVSDFTPPVFDSMPEDITVNCDEVTIAPSLTATDNCDDNVEITFDEVIGEGCPYTILRTWTAIDDCGNEATTTQLVTVIDEVAPEFDEFELFISIECDQVDDYIITASDNCDASVEVTIIEELLFSGGCIGTLQRTYQAMDDCGNTVTTTQLLQVVDTTAPELFNVPADVEINCEDEVPAVADDIFAIDNCSEDVTIEFTEIQTSEFCPYEIIRTWTAIDNCNNVTEGVQVITVTVDTSELVSLVTYPNPTDDRFTVEFSVPRDAEVAACVYDMAGREVMPVFKGTADARRLYQLEFSAFKWEAGSYVIMMTVDDKVYHHRMIITQQE
ncbi:MAG: T9SS type A sorting domain-containing protein [Flavobacteriales bacterium]|nr:T9SS type A sorting domain-containing protein [Flavobacteriales bacterium]